jgi:hypothetical protein
VLCTSEAHLQIWLPELADEIPVVNARMPAAMRRARIATASISR